MQTSHSETTSDVPNEGNETEGTISDDDADDEEYHQDDGDAVNDLSDSTSDNDSSDSPSDNEPEIINAPSPKRRKLERATIKKKPIIKRKNTIFKVCLFLLLLVFLFTSCFLYVFAYF
jgi:TFIIF-interacting CTD phosphatase-like protein